jgi:hypothetical protein
MQVIRTHRWKPSAPGRAAVTVLLTVMLLLLVAGEAQAAVPGQLLYAKRIGTSASEAGAAAVAAAPNGATVVAGWRESAAMPGGKVVMVAKYSAAGGRLWLRTYTAHAGQAVGVIVDPNGNIYVAARLQRSGADDIGLLAYSPTGTLQWDRFYDGPAAGDDRPAAIGFCGDGDVVVAGNSHAANGRVGIVVMKYHANADAAWAAERYDSDPADADAGSVYCTSVSFGCTNIYVAGWSEHRSSGVWTDSAQVVKFSGVYGYGMWQKSYQAQHNQSSRATGVYDADTSVYIVGSTRGSGETDGLIVRYSLGGDLTYNLEWGAGDGLNESLAAAIGDGTVYLFVTGYRRLVGPVRYQAVTMKLAAGQSSILWTRTYTSTHRYAQGQFITRDGDGNLYVSGVRRNSAGDNDLLALKYSTTGVRAWATAWSGGGSGNDRPAGIALGTKGGVYAAGEVAAAGHVTQSALLKYQK